METLIRDQATIYPQLESLGAQMQRGLEQLFDRYGIEATIARQGSAFCAYFMDHAPRDWYDVAQHHDQPRDIRCRRALIERGVYHFPLPTTQSSISAAHTAHDIDLTLEATEAVLRAGI